jgi:hypothetical protein
VRLIQQGHALGRGQLPAAVLFARSLLLGQPSLTLTVGMLLVKYLE